MNKVIKKSFQILVKNSAIMQPLILYILLMLLFGGLMGSKAFVTPVASIIFTALMFLLLTAFLAGWFNTIKFAVDNYINFDKKEKDYPMKVAVYNLDTGRSFFPGVGENFGAVLTLVITYSLFCTAIFILGLKIFNISGSEFYAALSDNANLTKFINSNPVALGAYILFVSGIIQVFQFLIMFWAPVIYYSTNNPLKSFWEALKFLFKNFFYAVGLYLFIVVSIFVMNILNFLCSKFYILSLIFIIAELYFVTYLLVLIFTAYKSKTVQNEIEKVNSQDMFIKSCELKEKDDADEK